MAVSITKELVRAALPRRKANAHKGDFGLLHIVAGSRQTPGAAVLCIGGALRAGAGLVRLFAGAEVCAAVAAHEPCCMLAPLRSGVEGGAAGATARAALQNEPTALLAGPGLGATDGIAALVRTLLADDCVPLVLDADALNVLAGHLETGMDTNLRRELLAALRARTAPTVLTPHPGEMARLAGRTTREVTQDHAACAQEFAEFSGATVVLKGHETVVATHGFESYANTAAGNPGLAKGGSGDVLAGIIAGLCAQTLAPHSAAMCGVWLHAAAADELAKRCGLYALSPADLPRALGDVFHALGR